tara:strand:+ start:293 stop:1045 length:753 start_codon:yes stop_codon:yes gene_type:complete
MGKYFNVEVKPTIVASTQTSAFAAGDILFDWASFQVPKGANKLLATTVLVRGKDGADVAAKDTEFYFAKTKSGIAPSTLGAGNAAVDTATQNGGQGWFQHLIGFQTFDVSSNNIGSSDDLVYMNMMQMPNRGGGQEIVLTGEPDSGDNVGFDTLYVAGIAQGAYDFASTIQCDGIQATSQNLLTVKTTDPRNSFVPGDIIHDENDRLMGTIQSVDSDTQLTMTSNLANATVNNKDLYNLSPITIILSFER